MRLLKSALLLKKSPKKEDYNPKLVNNAEKVLIAKVKVTEIVANKQNADNMDEQ